jgi:hypothetical protein
VTLTTSSRGAAAALSLAATAQEKKQDGEEPRVAADPCVGEACRHPYCGKEEPRPRVPPSALFDAAPGKRVAADQKTTGVPTQGRSCSPRG